MKPQTGITSLNTVVSNSTRPPYLLKSSPMASGRFGRVGFILTLITILCLCNFQLFSQATSASGKSLIVPPLVNYSGVLKDVTGKPLTGMVAATFYIYKDSQGGAPLWMETQNLQLDTSGHYSVMLGSTASSGLPGDLFAFGEPRWLSLQVQGEQEQPRALLVAVPYALKAADAATIGGLPPSAFVRATPEGIGSMSGSGPPSQIGSSSGSQSNSGKSASSLYSPCGSLTGSGTTNYLPLWTTGCNLGTSHIFQSGGSVGIGTTTPHDVLEVARGRLRVSDVTGGANYGNIFAGSSGGLVAFHVGSMTNVPLAFFTNASAPRMTIDTSGKVGIGTTTPAATLDVKGSINALTAYQIGVSNVLTIGSSADSNLFLGVAAGVHDIAGSGKYNVFSGYQAGYSNTTGSVNTFFGLQAGYNNTTASYNTFNGAETGFGNTTGSQNTFTGAFAGLNNTTGSSNTFSGIDAGTLNTTGSQNTFTGASAGLNNTTGSSNTFSGFNAGESNNTGTSNVFDGWQAGYSNTTGVMNVFVGTSAGYSNASVANTFVGDSAGYNNTNGTYNAFFGRDTGLDNIDGNFDTFLGHWAGIGNTHGNNNTFVGEEAGYANTIGSNNIFVGREAGYNNTTGGSDIYIGSPGIGTEGNAIRIGEQGTGIAQQNAAYVAGIYGSSVDSNGLYVLVDDHGQLGTTVSSGRFKEQIHDMGDSSSGLLKLRPVTFFYKPEYDKGTRTLQYGLIAEEVANVYPDLVAYDNEGKPYAVRYQYLAPMLLNELQKQHRRAEDQTEVIQAQQQEIESLKLQLRQQNASFEERLTKLESSIEPQIKTASDTQPTTSPNGGSE